MAPGFEGLAMPAPDRDRLDELQQLARTVATTAHEDLSGPTVESITEFADEVESHLAADERVQGAKKLLAFWESFVRAKLEAASDQAGAVADETVARFEQAFDEDVIGIDLYQALETLAIVEDMPEEETDEDRLGQWAARVQSLTTEFVDHLRGHQD